MKRSEKEQDAVKIQRIKAKTYPCIDFSKVMFFFKFVIPEDFNFTSNVQERLYSK